MAEWVFPKHAVGTGVHEEINFVHGDQNAQDVRQREGYEIWIHHRLIVFQLQDKR